MTATAIIVITVFFLLLAFFMIVFVFFYNQKRKSHIYEKNQIQLQHEQEILTAQLEIQEQTMKTVSQEIHDNVGQVLSLAKLYLNTLEGINDEAKSAKITESRQLVGKAINDLRDLSRSFYGDRITEMGLNEAIATELKVLQNSGVYETQLEISGNSYRFEPQKEIVLFRMVQEALHNSVKHAQPGLIKVKMHYGSKQFQLSIIDNGKGFEAGKIKDGKVGMGLTSMRNRAAMIGASFDIQSGPGGTEIKIEKETDN